MKLVITGATGYVATEVLRQALLLPSITSVVALARKPVPNPEGTEASKLKSVVVSDYGSYPDEVKKELAGAEACIWTVAITPSKAKGLDPAFVRKVCQEWAISGFKAMLEANPMPEHPFRFIYMSGTGSRDPNRPHSREGKQPWMPASMLEYGKMRGETATKLYDLAEKHKGQIEVCVAKPGFITGHLDIPRRLFGAFLSLTRIVDGIENREVAAAMLHHAVNGFDGTEGVLLNDEMVKLGREVLSHDAKP